MYRPECLNPFPADLADSLLEMALERTGLARQRLEISCDEEEKRLDEVRWRLVRAVDVSDKPCDD